MRNPRWLSSWGLALLVAACASPVKGITLVSTTDLEARLKSLILSNPLPMARGKVMLSWTEGLALSPIEESRSADCLGIERSYLAPAVDFRDPRYAMTREEALAAGLVDLALIELPRRAVSVDGLFPGEAGYPFEKELRLQVASARGHDRALLETWLMSVEPHRLSGRGKRPELLGAVGDIQVGKGEAPWLFQGEEGFRKLFGGALPQLRRPAWLVGNLEGPVTSGRQANPRKRYQFVFPPHATGSLKEAGFDLLLFANNHVLDFGEEGFISTLEDARISALPLVGAGEDLERALEGRRVTAFGLKDGVTLTFFGFARYPAEMMGFTTAEGAAGPGKIGTNSDESATLRAISEAAAKGEIVVVLAHGGSEYRFEPTEGIRALYRSFIDAGAALVLGSHPHVLQGVEERKGGIIAYSLGNFLFTGEVEPAMALQGSIFLFLVYEGKIRGLSLVPVVAGYAGTDLSSAPDDILSAFAARTAALAK